MQTSALPLVLVALYPCAALAILAVRPVLGLLNRLLKEDEDPRVASAWVVVGVSLGAAAVSGWALRAIALSDVAMLRVGDYALDVGSFGPLGAIALAGLMLLAGASMLRPLPDERTPAFALLLAGGAASLAILADDVRLTMLGPEGASLAAAGLHLDSRSPSESRAAAMRQWAAWQPGVLVVTVALAGVARRAEAFDASTMKAILYLDLQANHTALRWLFLGALALSVLPALPISLPDVASRRRVAASVAALGLSALLAAWVFGRCAYSAFPYAEGWEIARRGWLAIPACAACSVALLALAAWVRGPSPMVSLALAAQGPLALLALAQGRPALGAALLIAMALPLVRAAVLVLAAREAAAVGPAGQGALKRTHLAAAALVAVGYVGATLWLLPHFVDLRYRVAAILLLTAPSVWVAVRLVRFALTERVRPSVLTVLLASVAALLALAALAPKPGYDALIRRIGDEMGVMERLSTPNVIHRSAPPANHG